MSSIPLTTSRTTEPLSSKLGIAIGLHLLNWEERKSSGSQVGDQYANILSGPFSSYELKEVSMCMIPCAGCRGTHIVMAMMCTLMMPRDAFANKSATETQVESPQLPVLESKSECVRSWFILRERLEKANSLEDL